MKYLFFTFSLFLLSTCAAASSSLPVLFQNPSTGLYGFKDKSGRIKIEAQYPAAQKFNAHGIAAVAGKQGWKYIDTSGREILQPYIYDNGPDYFREGLARFVSQDKIGFMNKCGRVVIPAVFDFALPFSQGLAPVCQGCQKGTQGEHSRYMGGNWGYINKQGEMVIPAVYEQAAPFQQGKARVKVKDQAFFIDLPPTESYLRGNYSLAVIYGPGDELHLPLPLLPHKPEIATLDKQSPFVRVDGIYCTPAGDYLEGLCRFRDKTGLPWQIQFTAEPLLPENLAVFTLLIVQEQRLKYQSDFAYRGKPGDILNLGVAPVNFTGLPLQNQAPFSISLLVKGQATNSSP